MCSKKYIVPVILVVIFIDLLRADEMNPYLEASKRIVYTLKKNNVTCSDYVDYCSERVKATLKLAASVSGSADESEADLQAKLKFCEEMVKQIVC